MDYIRLVINIILTIAFYYLFGRVNIATFSQASVSFTKIEETMTKVPSPGKRIRIKCNAGINCYFYPAIFPVDLADYKDMQPMCNGNETVEEFANCIVENTVDNVKMDKPHTRADRIYYENVMPSFLPVDGSIGFNSTTATSIYISFTTNTTYAVWFMDRNFAFLTLNPSISPREAMTIKDSGVIIFIFLKVRKRQTLIQINLLYISTGLKKNKTEPSK